MAPKRKDLSELGKASPHGGGWRVEVKLDGRTVLGAQRNCESDAVADLEEARRAGTREGMRAYLEALKGKSSSSTGADSLKRKSIEDGRVRNKGSPGNKGGSGAGRKALALNKTSVRRHSFKTYKIEGLDLSAAKLAQDLHPWTDQCTVNALMQKLSENGGGMTFEAYHSHSRLHGRLLVQWPTLLHVNRAFRACILWPQSAAFTDLDMKSAHNHICQYLAQGKGLVLTELPKYLQPDAKARFEAELTSQGLSRRDAKQLWLSLLNNGTVQGWRHGLMKTYGGGLKVGMSAELREHLKQFRSEVMIVREQVLGELKWARRYDDLVKPASNGRTLPKEKALRKLWNAALTTVESSVLGDLEKLVESGAACPGARVVMPSYDGLLVQHGARVFDVGKLQILWKGVCQKEYKYDFPLEVKAIDADLPGWVRRLAA